MNGDTAKGLFKWIVCGAIVVAVCTGLILYVNDLSRQTTELRVEKRLTKITIEMFKRNQAALDQLAEVTLKSYQQELLRMTTEIKLLREEIVSLKQELRECVAIKKQGQ